MKAILFIIVIVIFSNLAVANNSSDEHFLKAKQDFSNRFKTEGLQISDDEAVTGDLNGDGILDYAAFAENAYTQALRMAIFLGKLQLMTGAGVTWQSEKLNHYYFGVNASEAQKLVVQDSMLNRTGYQADAALAPKVNALAIYSLSKSWALIGGAEVEFLPEEITDSPIIGEKNAWGMFAGIAKAF